MDNIEQLKKLSDELDLSFESQDWGIVNSSADRVGEFMNYFSNKKSLNESMRYQLFELIIASFNDALLEDKCNEKLKNEFKALVDKYSKNEILQPILNYWKSIDGDEYPVNKFL